MTMAMRPASAPFPSRCAVNFPLLFTPPPRLHLCVIVYTSLLQVTGSWMTKIEALLRRLLLMRSAEPGSKALVFSQYPDALALISKALHVMQVSQMGGTGGGRLWTGSYFE